jgi:hypothetical protein
MHKTLCPEPPPPYQAAPLAIDAQLQFIEERLDAAKDAHVRLVIGHHPIVAGSDQLYGMSRGCYQCSFFYRDLNFDRPNSLLSL